MPSFELEYEKNLVEALQYIGLTCGFSESADFSGVSKTYLRKITKVIHKTKIEVNPFNT